MQWLLLHRNQRCSCSAAQSSITVREHVLSSTSASTRTLAAQVLAGSSFSLSPLASWPLVPLSSCQTNYSSRCAWTRGLVCDGIWQPWLCRMLAMRVTMTILLRWTACPRFLPAFRAQVLTRRQCWRGTWTACMVSLHCHLDMECLFAFANRAVAYPTPALLLGLQYLHGS